MSIIAVIAAIAAVFRGAEIVHGFYHPAYSAY